jgi:hypothetical protein
LKKAWPLPFLALLAGAGALCAQEAAVGEGTGIPRLFPSGKRGEIMALARANASALGLPFFESAPAGTAPLGDPLIPLSLAGNAPVPRPAEPESAPPLPSDAPVPWPEIEKVVKFGHRFGWAKELSSRCRRFRRRDDPADQAEALARSSLDFLQKTPAGREVLRELVSEYRRMGRTVLVDAEDFPLSAVLSTDGQEGIAGVLGSAITATAGGLYPISFEYSFNRKFLGFKDRELAAQILATNMAHEFRHLVICAQTMRKSSFLIGPISSILGLMNEQRAFLTGGLVALQMGFDKPNEAVERASRMAQDPDAFWKSLKRISDYGWKFDLEELKDPASAFASRIAAVEERRSNIREVLLRGIPEMESKLDVMTRMEGLGPEADELRGQLRARSSFLSKEAEALGSTLRGLRLLASMEPVLGGGLRSMAGSELFKGLYADLERDQRALAEALKSRPPRPREEMEDSLSWERFDELVRKSMKEHPWYWEEHFNKFPGDRKSACLDPLQAGALF